MKCLICHFENPDNTIYCGKCATSLKLPGDISISKTKTVISPIAEGSAVAGKYRIIEKLGEGGMGVVYKAEDIRLERTVALKFLPSDLTRDKEARERFVQEAKSASALDHVNICTIHEINETEDEQVFIAMAYYKGKSLKEKMKEGSLKQDESINIAIQVAEGLIDAHQKGIIHRDIKPANIMVTNDGIAKILDFGLAKLSGQVGLTKTQTTMGTVAYMSPEQAKGETVDHRTDIWSLGVVLYEMLTNKLPFKGNREQSVMYSIMNEEPEPVSKIRDDILPALEDVISQALSKDLNSRYQNMYQILNDLQLIQKGFAPEVKRISLGKRYSERKKVYVFAGIAIILIMIVLAWRFMIVNRPETFDSIAVLPLTNISGDPEQEYFSDGMTGELISELAKIKALRVISKTSVMQYKKGNKSIPQIAEELDVDAIVEGSILHAEDKVHIKVQLIKARPEQHLWINDYENVYRNIIALQKDVARAIAQEIQIIVSPEEEAMLAKAYPVNPEAHEAYLKGRQKVDTEDPAAGLELFQQAIDLDPTYAPPYAWLARSYSFLLMGGKMSPLEAFPKMKELVMKAIELDDELAFAYAMLALIKQHGEGDLEGADREFKRALELEPNNDQVIRLYASGLTTIPERHGEAIAMAKRALELNPHSIDYNWFLGWTYYHTRHYKEAVVQLKKTSEISKQSSIFLSLSYAFNKMYDEANTECDKLKAILREEDPQYQYALGTIGYIYAHTGRRDEAKKILDKIMALSENEPLDAYNVAIIYIGLGEKDLAFQWIERGIEEHSPSMWLTVDPIFDILRNDPKFDIMLRKQQQVK